MYLERTKYVLVIYGEDEVVWKINHFALHNTLFCSQKNSYSHIGNSSNKFSYLLLTIYPLVVVNFTQRK